MTDIVHSVLRPAKATSRRQSSRAKEELGLDVGGYISSTSEHVRWKTPKIRTGDEVRIRIIETVQPDKPSSRERADPNERLNAEKKYVERTAKKLGWKIVKTPRNPKRPVVK